MTTDSTSSALSRLTAQVGQQLGVGAWVMIDQARIDAFADVTEDWQFIHVDPEACARLSPWGVPIAHGFLTLSLLTRLCAEVHDGTPELEGLEMGVNYGLDKVRFVSAVPVGSEVRAVITLSSVERAATNQLHVVRHITVELKGAERPALVADWITRLAFSG